MRSARWHKGMKRLLWIGMLLAPQMAHAQTGGQMANPVVMVIVLGVLALAPFIVVMLTSFVKISVVLSILRNALGTQQVPPNQIITGLAFVLTIFIMVPVGRQMYEQANVANTKDIFSEASIKSLFDAAKKAKEPLRHFLSQHSHVKDRELFMELAVRLERNALANERPGISRQLQRPQPGRPGCGNGLDLAQASVAAPGAPTPPSATGANDRQGGEA